MLRPRGPAPMTATVLISATPRSALVESIHHGHVVGLGLAHVVGQAFALIPGHAGHAGLNTPQGGGNVIDVIHHADQFTGHYHAVCRSLCQTTIVKSGASLV